MADLTVQTLTRGYQGTQPGTAPNYQSWTDDDTFDNNGKTRLLIKGAASATGSVIVSVQDSCPYFGVSETPITTTAGALNGTTKRVVLGPFPASWVNNSSGKAVLSSSGTVTNTTIAVIADPEDDGNN